LTLGRSNAPTRVLQPMKSVVNAVTAMIDDVRAFERKAQRDHTDVDIESLQALRERAEATLSNLAVASKTHATSAGMSPVSLLDAAASHVSVTITEMGKSVQIRKATKVEQERFSMTQYSQSTSTPASGFVSNLRSIDEAKPPHQRKSSGLSVSSNKGRYYEATTSPYGRSTDPKRRPQSDNSSSEQTNSPPPIFDQQNSGGGMSDDSGAAEGPEDNWAELTVNFLKC
jgi:protein SPA2